MIHFFVLIAGIMIGLILGICIRVDANDRALMDGLVNWEPEQ